MRYIYGSFRHLAVNLRNKYLPLQGIRVGEASGGEITKHCCLRFSGIDQIGLPACRACMCRERRCLCSCCGITQHAVTRSCTFHFLPPFSAHPMTASWIAEALWFRFRLVRQLVLAPFPASAPWRRGGRSAERPHNKGSGLGAEHGRREEADEQKPGALGLCCGVSLASQAASQQRRDVTRVGHGGGVTQKARPT